MSTAQNGLSISPEQRGQRGGGRGREEVGGSGGGGGGGRVEEVKKKVCVVCIYHISSIENITCLPSIYSDLPCLEVWLYIYNIHVYCPSEHTCYHNSDKNT